MVLGGVPISGVRLADAQMVAESIRGLVGPHGVRRTTDFRIKV